jgi:co-chaperonin GroES (HSP10)
MKPIGKTYLIKCKAESITNEGGIYVVNSVDEIQDSFWKGVVVGYGTKVDESKDDVVPIGTTVIMDTSKKSAAKMILKKTQYIVRDIDDIVGVIEDE